MKDISDVLRIIVIIAVLFVVGSTGLGLVPWYLQENPMMIVNNNGPFHPGQLMQLRFTRRALIGFRGQVVRELVRIRSDNGMTEEIWRSSVNTSVDRGKKTITLSYRLPTLAMYPEMQMNTYRWQGVMSYKPFGLVEKAFFFETEEFQIEADEPNRP